ncbi:MAG: endonuclease [Deltaproteobacteria bacterium CG07_land_8_20_14_0_80_38_7]|nr:MAG: endonuclease [Deltaproteobacteria bacterium CG07_land_8_20_14_0_80_38_7]
MKNSLIQLYSQLFDVFGAQYWWPGDTPIEIIVGAILTQNTSWKNVEKAINNLKRKSFLSAAKLYELPEEELAELIRPAGYFRVKTKRLRNFLKFFLNDFNGNILLMQEKDLLDLRENVLFVNGIGPETADSILLYALDKPIFVVDAYTKRILVRHNLITEDFGYYDIQQFFMDNLPTDVKLFNEYHALLVKCGKDFCKPNNPRCKECPLNGFNIPAAQ